MFAVADSTPLQWCLFVMLLFHFYAQLNRVFLIGMSDTPCGKEENPFLVRRETFTYQYFFPLDA